MNNEDNHFYITTPIYYVNDKPHIGHAYTTIIADVLARYNRLLGRSTYFLTGTDEHGQKVAQAAEKNNITPIEHCDSTVVRFQKLWSKLEITNDDFIRTTEDRHKKIVQSVLQSLFEKGEIYKADYEGWYCVPCERFFTEKDLENNMCPECNREVEKIVEKNYFFKMSQYQPWLVNYINEHPDFIQPAHRRNETLGFLKQPLGDLCISRPKSRLSWGIELPFDGDYVCYVWFDALLNYISAPGYLSDPKKFESWWPASYHVIGKDILTTHTVYWPTMLKAMDVPLPRSIFAHGWWLSDNDKMAKSTGNVVDPMPMSDKYGVDALRYFLLAEMTPGQDANFTEEVFISRYNSDLADSLGNMLNRVVKFIQMHCDSVIPTPGELSNAESELRSVTLNAVEDVKKSIQEIKLNRGLFSVLEAVRATNRYFEKNAPWKLVKAGETAKLATVLYTAAEALRVISALLYPVMPAKMKLLRATLGQPEHELEPKLNDISTWGKLTPGSRVHDVESLFPRIQVEKSEKSKSTKNGNSKERKTNKTNDESDGLIDFKDFLNVKLKVAKIITAEKIENADRLLRLEISLGDKNRQIVAGIAQSYSAESLIGKFIVVVANLKPAKIRGLRSEGMLLAAKDDGKLRLITVDGDCTPGNDVG